MAENFAWKRFVSSCACTMNATQKLKRGVFSLSLSSAGPSPSKYEKINWIWKKKEKRKAYRWRVRIDGIIVYAPQSALEFLLFVIFVDPDNTRIECHEWRKKMNTFRIEIYFSKFLSGLFSHLQNETKARCYECQDIQGRKSMRSHRLCHLCVPCVWCFSFSCKSIKCVKMNDTFAVSCNASLCSMCCSESFEPLDRILYILSMRQSATF